MERRLWIHHLLPQTLLNLSEGKKNTQEHTLFYNLDKSSDKSAKASDKKRSSIYFDFSVHPAMQAFSSTPKTLKSTEVQSAL